MIKFLYVIFLLPILTCINTYAEQEWDQIKNHGPHAGIVQMNKSKTLGIEVISRDNGVFQLFVLASNYDSIDANDLKVTVYHSSDIKNIIACVQKTVYTNCQISSKINDGELTFRIKSKSKNLDEQLSIKLPLTH